MRVRRRPRCFWVLSRLVLGAGFFAVGLWMARWRARRAFRRALVRAGLPPSAVHALSQAYAQGLSFGSFLHGTSTPHAPRAHRKGGE